MIESTEQRLSLVKKILAMSFFLGILFSPTLWLPKRFFPFAPILGSVSDSPVLGMTLIICLLLGLLCLPIFNKKVFVYVSLVSLILLLVQDQLRWQPWVYIYLLVLTSFALESKMQNHEDLLQTLQVIFIGVYLWSGLHKLNPNFIDITFRSILTQLFRITDGKLLSSLRYFGYLIPLTELSIGLALCFPKTRNSGVLLAVLTHVFIMVYLSPLGINYNYVVYPWNLAMIFFVSALFFRTNNNLKFWYIKDVRLKYLALLLVLIVWIAPSLNFVNRWDNYLSFSFYSDKINGYYIAIEESELIKTDRRLSDYYVKIKGLKGGQVIDLNKWSMSELNVPFYPETRVFKKVCRVFCELGIEDEKLIFLEIEQRSAKVTSFKCSDLNF